MILRTGLAALSAYPTDSYYDPNRPSWLPYWLDDFTESEAKYAWLASGGKVTAQQIVNPGAVYTAPAAPPTVSSPTGSALTTAPASGAQAQAQVDAILAKQITDWQAQNQSLMNTVDKNLNRPLCNQLLGDGSAICTNLGTIGIGAVAVVGLIVIMSARR